MACRSKQRAEEAIAQLKKEKLPGKVVFIQLDLANLNNIKGFPSRFKKYEDHLDMLFNNGGVAAFKPNQLTSDGYEIMLGTNALGHHYLTRLMIPFLEESQRLTPNRPPRVCFTSSMLHRFASPEGFTPKDPTGAGSKPFYVSAENRMYGTSKLANILSANKFQREFGAKGIVFTSVHPGVAGTGIFREMNPVMRWFMSLFFDSMEKGCLTQLYAVTAPGTETKGGCYFVPVGKEEEPLPIAKSAENQDLCMFLQLTQSTDGPWNRSRTKRKNDAKLVLVPLYISHCYSSFALSFPLQRVAVFSPQASGVAGEQGMHLYAFRVAEIF